MTENNFINAFNNVGHHYRTQNGAHNYVIESINHPLVRTLYGIENQNAEDLFEQALKQPDLFNYCVKFAFMVRDPSEGIGKRNLGRIMITKLFNKLVNNHETTKNLVTFIVDGIKNQCVYGRWDDVIYYIEHVKNPTAVEMMKNIIASQFRKDYTSNEHISLLAKWLPSINASSKTTRQSAKNICSNILHLNYAQYRKCLSTLRTKINIVEHHLHDGENGWESIIYSSVPSLAHNRYREQFFKHDEERYAKYVKDVVKGKSKINTTNLTLPQLVAKIVKNTKTDNVINNMIAKSWSDILEKYPNFNKNIIPVCDISGSMFTFVNSNTTAYHVATSLSMFFAHKNIGTLHGKILTFSNEPTVINLNNNNVIDNLNTIENSRVGYSTNIEKTLDLLLNLAKANHCKQDEISTLILFSDMEFNEAVNSNVDYEVLFETLRKRWNDAGFDFPKIIFWNINSKSVPLQTNKNGMVLIGGYNQNLYEMVISNNYDPWSALKEKLDSERYNITI